MLLQVLPDLTFKGLLIDPPWIAKILTGSKTWELQGEKTHARGLIGPLSKVPVSINAVAPSTVHLFVTCVYPYTVLYSQHLPAL